MSRAALAREKRGLTPQKAARLARITVPYLHRVEREGAPFHLAQRLSALYGCPLDYFLPTGNQTQDRNRTTPPVRCLSEKGRRTRKPPAS